MKVDHAPAIAEMNELIKDMGEPLRGSVVKTGSRIIHRLRVEVQDLREANQGLALALKHADPTAVDVTFKGFVDNALCVVTHNMSRVAGMDLIGSDGVANQAHALKVLAEAVSILARGFSPDVLGPTKQDENEGDSEADETG